MAAGARKVHKQTFNDGINTVLSRENMPPTMARKILNGRYLSTSSGEVGVISNIMGNVLIETDLPDGENEEIGWAEDKENNKFYSFLWNSNNYHSIYEYDSLQRKFVRIFQSITDSNGVDILRFDRRFKILTADVIDGKLTWCDGLNPARKTNLSKIKDRSSAGYGDTILEEFISAYKAAPVYGPTVGYFTDVTKKFNNLYGKLYKFAYRFIYDDFEKSTWSDWSEVPLPPKESFTGLKYIPSDNNGISIKLETGGRTVVKIEIAAKFGQEDWRSIIILDKEELAISNNSTYEYKFYNDASGSYPGILEDKIIKHYSYLPSAPRLQSYVRDAMVYINFNEGFPIVKLKVSSTVDYEPLYIESGVENQFNKPQLILNNPPAGWQGESGDYWDGSAGNSQARDLNGKPVNNNGRANIWGITVGSDVKKGNTYNVSIRESGGGASIDLSYTATISDTAVTVVNQLRQRLIDTGKILSWVREIGSVNIYENFQDGQGNVTFKFIITSFHKKHKFGYPALSGSVNPVQFNTLKDTGESVQNIKLDSTIKYAIVYHDADGRKSLAYTNNSLIIYFKSLNELGGIKHPVVRLSINHRPPIWAKYYEIVRTTDLTSSKYLQMLIQKVNEVQETESGEYLDLVVGSLFTYQKAHENTILRYEFQKGDRIKFIRKTSNGSYYPKYETEILSYKETTTDIINASVTINGDLTVTVGGTTNETDVGKFIQIDSVEREIVAVNGTEYTVNAPIGKSDTPETYPSYTIVDRRGTVRIRKPSSDVISEVEDYSIVEFYKPNLNAASDDKRFFSFGKKLPIINPFTEQAMHSGSVQDQTLSLPAIVKIDEGTSYVRNRELPTTNAKPAQVIVEPVEDPNYSDFYESSLNDNGKAFPEDDGRGVVHFGSRARFSNNYITDTAINGLSEFDANDKVDYNDQYGDIVFIHFDNNRLYTFKEFKTCWIPVYATLIQDNSGANLLGASRKLLNDIQYFAGDSGIGRHPRTFASLGTMKYFVSSASGTIVRIGGDGETPISKVYNVDNEVREILREADRYGAEIIGGVDEANGEYIFSVKRYEKDIFSGNFSDPAFETEASIPTLTGIIINTEPHHGTVSLNGLEITYTPTAGYTGPDTFSYTAVSGGAALQSRNVCIEVEAVQNRLTGWRALESSASCEKDGSNHNTGFKMWATLQEYYLDNGAPTGQQKPNVESDPNYVPPVYDVNMCPLFIPDTNPDPFTFNAITNAQLSTVYQSEVRTITGINVPIWFSVNVGEFRINGGGWMQGASLVNNGDTVQVRVSSSSAYTTPVTVTATANNYSTPFTVTTMSQQVYPAKWIADIVSARCEQSFSPDETGVVVMDLTGNDDLNVLAYVHTPNVAISDSPAYHGLNKFPNDGRDPKDCYVLSSGLIENATNKRRFQWNLSKLMTDFPTQRYFGMQVRGRKVNSGPQNIIVSLRGADQGYMVLNYSEANNALIPGVTNSNGLGQTNYTFTIAGGANGDYNMGLPIFVTLIYDRVIKTLSVAAGDQAVPDVAYNPGSQNTGYLIITKLVKVSDDVNQYPLDVNGMRTSDSGLPQANKPNIDTDPDYIPKMFNLGYCPIGGGGGSDL